MANESPTPLLTTEQVILWRDERANVADEIESLQVKLASLDRKLEAVALLLPDLARKLFGHRSDDDAKPLHEQPWTSIVLSLVDGEKGGRTARWFREKVVADPDLSERFTASPTGLHNALSRLASRGELEKRDNLYYLPETLTLIESGELEEDEEEGNISSIASVMNEILATFPNGVTAGEMVSEARNHPILRERAERSSTFVYSFLSREAFRHRLIKEGDVYRFPSKRDGAPTADAGSAPTAGEGATSSNKSGGDFNDLLR